MEIYAPYLGRLKRPEGAGMGPVAICGGRPRRSDGRACAPMMEPSGGAAIPTATHEGVESTIERKMEAGGIGRPRETFENMLGETYGARRGKAD